MQRQYLVPSFYQKWYIRLGGSKGKLDVLGDFGKLERDGKLEELVILRIYRNRHLDKALVDPNGKEMVS